MRTAGRLACWPHWLMTVNGPPAMPTGGPTTLGLEIMVLSWDFTLERVTRNRTRTISLGISVTDSSMTGWQISASKRRPSVTVIRGFLPPHRARSGHVEPSLPSVTIREL